VNSGLPRERGARNQGGRWASRLVTAQDVVKESLMPRRVPVLVALVVCLSLPIGAVASETASFSLPTLTEIWNWLTGEEEKAEPPNQCPLQCQLRADGAIGQCRGNINEAAIERTGEAPPAANCRLKVAEGYEACMAACGTPVPARLIERRMLSRTTGMTPERVQEMLRERRQVKP
jgi:hypothetical protein